MIFLYRLIINCAYVLVYPFARFKMIRGREMWRDRLGKTNLRPCDVWLHASSVGEVTIITYLVAWLRTHRPGLRIHVTTMTASGYETARKRLDGSASISFFPIDKRSIMRRTQAALRPTIVVIAETEIWPNLIVESRRQNVHLIKVNARISPKAFKRYFWVRATIGRLIAEYDRIFCKTEEDHRRYLALGATATQAVVGGDMKFDAPLTEKSTEQVRQYRQSLGIGEGDFLLVAGSTRPGEEEILLDLYVNLKPNYPNLRLLLAPRHLERLGDVRSMIESRGLAIESVGAPSTDNNSILLLEQMGILNRLYNAADLAFVGGTLVDIGGHNLLEPVWAQTPVLYGPYLSNVREAAEYIESHNYGTRVRNGTELYEVVRAVVDGNRRFAVKTAEDLSHSAVALAGQNIIRRLSCD